LSLSTCSLEVLKHNSISQEKYFLSYTVVSPVREDKLVGRNAGTQWYQTGSG